MDDFSSRVESGLLQIAVPFAFAITRLTSLKKEVVFAQSVLQDLIRDFDDTQRQLVSLRDFLERAEFSQERHHQCDLLVRDIHVNVNKLTNLIEHIGMKLTQKGFFRRSKHRLSLVDSDLGDVQWHIEKINRNIEIIRQEMILEIVINSRIENREQNNEITEEIQKVNKNLTGTDAKRIRKIYSKVAVDLMDPWSFLVVNPASSSQQSLPQQEKEDKIQILTPVEITEITEILPPKFTQLDIDIAVPGMTDLADVKEAIGRILERSNLEQSTFTQNGNEMKSIAELPA